MILINRTIFLTLFVELGIAIVQERFFLSYRLVSRSWTGMVISHDGYYLSNFHACYQMIREGIVHAVEQKEIY